MGIIQNYHTALRQQTLPHSFPLNLIFSVLTFFTSASLSNGRIVAHIRNLSGCIGCPNIFHYISYYIVMYVNTHQDISLNSRERLRLRKIMKA